MNQDYKLHVWQWLTTIVVVLVLILLGFAVFNKKPTGGSMNIPSTGDHKVNQNVLLYPCNDGKCS